MEEVIKFLHEMRKEVGQGSYFQLGDFLYRTKLPYNNFDEKEDIKLWITGDRVEAFVFYLSCMNNPEIFIRPRNYNNEIAKEVLEWVEVRKDELNHDEIETSCIDGDKAKEDFLSEHGFESTDDTMVFMKLDLGNSYKEVAIGGRYKIVEGFDRKYIEKDYDFVDNSSFLAFEEVQERKELALRVVMNNEVVGKCIYWYDEEGRSAELEPIEVSEKHRKKGLASSLILYGLNKLIDLEVEEVYVRTEEGNKAAIELYKKHGFCIEYIDRAWVK